MDSGHGDHGEAESPHRQAGVEEGAGDGEDPDADVPLDQVQHGRGLTDPLTLRHLLQSVPASSSSSSMSSSSFPLTSSSST